MPAPACAADVELGLLAAMFGGSDPSAATMPFIVRACLTKLLHDGPEALAELAQKFEAADSLAAFVRQRTGFEGALFERDSLQDFAAHVLLTAAASLVPAAALQKLSNHIAPAYAPYCIAVVREWAGDAAASDDLREICELVQDACGLRHVFGALPTDDLLRLDVFPCVDEAILSDLLASLAQGADRVDEARRVAAARRDLCWYDDVACYYQVLLALADMAAFKRDHAGGFHIAQAAEVWEAYTSDWWRMDAAYRALRQANERCKLRGVDLLEEPSAARSNGPRTTTLTGI